MPDLMAVIDGKSVPLADCSWVQTMACGCIATVATAAYGDTAYATEQQIHEETEPLKRVRDRQIKNGFTWELLTFEDYKARYAGPDAWKCKHTFAQRTGRAPIDDAFPPNGGHDSSCAYVGGIGNCTCTPAESEAMR